MNKHVVSYEVMGPSGWSTAVATISARFAIAPILREMNAQHGLIRNVNLVRSAA